MLAASKGHKCVTIEASPCNFQVLSKNVELNGKKFTDLVDLHNIALTRDVSKSSVCIEAGEDVYNKGNVLIRGKTVLPECHEFFNIKTATLSSVLESSKGNIGFLKADCEGCEASALIR